MLATTSSTNPFVPRLARWISLFVLAVTWTPGAPCGAEEPESIVSLMAKPALNVVITVSDMERAKEFYGGVMGLKPMAPILFPAGTNPVFFTRPTEMTRYQVGRQEIKLITPPEPLEKRPGGIGVANGFRMLAFPLEDPPAFFKRIEDRGLARPEVHTMGDGSAYRYGLLDDPDGNQVEFYYYEGERPAGAFEGLQIALTVSDVEKTREFYGGVLGLEEVAAVPMPGRPETMVHLFRLGETTIKFWSFGPGLPTYSGRHLAGYGFRYLQYQVRDIDAAYERVKAAGATIELPPTPMRSMPVSLMFVADPDGIINEFFGMKR